MVDYFRNVFQWVDRQKRPTTAWVEPFSTWCSKARQLLSRLGCFRVLHISDPAIKDDLMFRSILDVLKSKHPPSHPASVKSLLLNDQEPPEVHCHFVQDWSQPHLYWVLINQGGSRPFYGWYPLIEKMSFARCLCTFLVDHRGLLSLLTWCLDKCQVFALSGSV